jgi:hypothetical protein
MKDATLVICLSDGSTIDVPDLKPEIVEVIFAAHASYLDSQAELANPTQSPSKAGAPLFSTIAGDTEIPFRLGFGTFDALGSALQHNPSQSNAPNLPKEILSKISAIAKIVAPEDGMSIPKAEPHCNCVHCQIARAIQGGLEGHQSEELEEVSNEDLTFCQWEITQTGEKLYSVINRLDSQEKYSVYLGHPVGCTCGKQGCEHILAVLKS